MSPAGSRNSWRSHPFDTLASLAAFMVPGLALWLPSGYSWGALVLLLASLAGAATWWRRPLGTEPRRLLLSIALMGAIWLLDVSAQQGLRSLDKPSKYLLAVPCLLFLLVWRPRPQALAWGLAFGAFGSGCVALYQTAVGLLGEDHRVTGFTNAIQYGNLSILLAVMCCLWAAAQGSRLPRWQQLVFVGAALLGVLGSLLSQSRGGWLAVALSLPLWAWLLLRWRHARLVVYGGALTLAILGAAVGMHGNELQHRVNEAYEEASTYVDGGDAANSVGQRLDHWRLAWSMGWEQPWLGWGHEGYKAEKRRRVEAGEAQPIVLQYDHAHNEVLDLFVKRGILGVAALLVFYAVPLWLFWPLPSRLASPPYTDRTALALHLVGLSLPLLYIGFGFTQVFMAHNSGNMFYLFMVMLVYTALLRQRGTPVPARF